MSSNASDGKPNFRIGGVTRIDTPKPAPVPAPVAPPIAQTANLDELERQLRASLADVQRQKQEQAKLELLERERQEREKHIVITVRDFAGGMVIVRSNYRTDLVDFWRSIPGRAFRGEQDNAIPIGEWVKNVEANLLAMPHTDVIYAKGIKEAIDYHLNAPKWLIELDKRVMRLTPGPRASSYDVTNVPGVEWQGVKNPNQKWFTVPLSEAYNVFEALEKVEGVLWTEEAKEFTINQIQQRASLDSIGKATEWPYEPGFINDHKLRPFQGVGCAFIEATNGRALLAYEMGLGKTPMSLAYAWKNKFRTIIVCPATLKPNWCRQILKFTGVAPNVLMGAEPSKFDLVQLLTSPSLFTIINYDILGRKVEYDDVTQDANEIDHVEHKVKFLWVDCLNMSKPDLIICDESHYIKNTDSNRSVAVRRLVAPHIVHMTGTPVLNRPGELWPILTHLQPSSFPSEDTFIRQYTVDGKRAKNVEQLRESIKSIMIRRKHSDVKKDLPPRNPIEEYVDLSPKAQKLYRKVLQGVYEAIAEYDAKGRGGSESTVADILVKIQRLKQVCAIDKVNRSAELAIELHESAIEERHNKVIIFSQFKGPAYRILQLLGHEAVGVVRRGISDFVTADLNERDRLVQQFQNDPAIKYFVATEKTMKEGHDMTEAGFVIYNDLFWTPAAHDQAGGRAYMRENDPHDITEYYLITDKGETKEFEIEEWIWELLGIKKNTINETVEGVESSRSDVSVAMALISRMKEGMWSRKR